MPGTLTVTILSTTMNIRRGPSNAGGIIGRATVGEQFEVLQVLDTPDSKEQWARIEYKDFPQAYLCTRLANGNSLAQVSVKPGSVESEDYKRGWNECIESLHRVLVTLRK